MEKVRITVFSVVIALVMCLSLTPANLFAKNMKEVNGEYIITGLDIESVVQRSPNVCILKGTIYANYSGDLEGDGWLDMKLIHYGSCDFAVPEPGNFHGKGLFVGTVDGTEGAFELSQVGKDTAEGGVVTKIVIQKGYDGLQGLHGLLKLEGIVLVGGTYTGRLHYAP